MTVRSTPVVMSGAVALICACASSGSAPATTTPAPVIASAQGGSAVPLSVSGASMGTTGQTASVRASRDSIWAKLPGAYESLGIPVSIRDESRFRIGNDQLKARRALNGVQMRAILDCGSDLNGEKAESYDIRLTIETTVAPSESGDTQLTTMVSGLGRSPNFGNTDVNCSTKGELERRILRYVRLQLGLPGK